MGERVWHPPLSLSSYEVIWYHDCSSTRIGLVLDNPQRLICHWKIKKPSQVIYQIFLFQNKRYFIFWWFGFFCLMAYQLFRLFNAKAILLEEQQWYYLTHSWQNKGVHTFPKGICLKVNVIGATGVWTHLRIRSPSL